MPALLHRRFPELARTLPRVELCDLPTAVRPLEAITRRAGREVWVKDDGQSGELWGGNKPRKLEWTLADARRRRARTILTVGGLGTNHGLATALYARRAGLRSVLALVDQPLDAHVERQLERIRAAADRVVLTRTTPRTAAALPWLLVRHGRAWPPRPAYWLPPGGSSPLGTVGFVEAGLELAEQVRAGELPEPAALFVALGSGGSAAGLLAGFRLAGLDTRVVAVLVNDMLRLSEATVERLAGRTLRLLRSRGAGLPGTGRGAASVQVPRDFLGSGYGHPTPQSQGAIELARDDGLALDPVYTGKALAALLALAGNRSLPDGPLLYWHTHSAVPAALAQAPG